MVEELGRGGSGIVYRAMQLSLCRVVAVKMLRGGEFSDADDLARFLQEAKIAAGLKHPNIVDVYNTGVVRGQPFIVFEFVDGPSLARRIDGTPLPNELAARIVASVARAIAEAHERGIVHRESQAIERPLGGAGRSSHGQNHRLRSL